MHLGLGYLVAYARMHHDDLEFTYLDTRVASSKETNAFFNTHFDLIGMTVFCPVYFEVKSLFRRIRKQHPTTPICLGGPYVTTIMQLHNGGYIRPSQTNWCGGMLLPDTAKEGFYLKINRAKYRHADQIEVGVEEGVGFFA